MPNPNPTITPEFEQAAKDRRMSDLTDSDKLGDKVFSCRMPLDIQEYLMDGKRKRNDLMRKIVVDVIRSHPELLAQCEAELNG